MKLFGKIDPQLKYSPPIIQRKKKKKIRNQTPPPPSLSEPHPLLSLSLSPFWKDNPELIYEFFIHITLIVI